MAVDRFEANGQPDAVRHTLATRTYTPDLSRGWLDVLGDCHSILSHDAVLGPGMTAAGGEFLVLQRGRFSESCRIESRVDRTEQSGGGRISITDPLNLERITVDIDDDEAVTIEASEAEFTQLPSRALQELESGGQITGEYMDGAWRWQLGRHGSTDRDGHINGGRPVPGATASSRVGRGWRPRALRRGCRPCRSAWRSGLRYVRSR